MHRGGRRRWAPQKQIAQRARSYRQVEKCNAVMFFFSFADGPLSTAHLHKEGRGFSARYRQQPTEQRWVRARTHCVSCHTKFGGALCTKQDDHRRAGIEVRHAIRAAAFAEKSFISRTQVLWSLQFVSSRCSSLCIWLFWGMDWWARVTSEKRFRRGRRNKELLANRARIYYIQRACLCNSLSSFQINGLCAEKLSVFFFYYYVCAYWVAGNA